MFKNYRKLFQKPSFLTSPYTSQSSTRVSRQSLSSSIPSIPLSLTQNEIFSLVPLSTSSSSSSSSNSSSFSEKIKFILQRMIPFTLIFLVDHYMNKKAKNCGIVGMFLISISSHLLTPSSCRCCWCR